VSAAIAHLATGIFVGRVSGYWGFSNMLGFAAGFIISWVGHTLYTFPRRRRLLESLFPLFGVLIFGLIYSFLTSEILLMFAIYDEFTTIFVVFTGPIFTYLLTRFWVFSRKIVK
jgi:putative flippase GtrA